MPSNMTADQHHVHSDKIVFYGLVFVVALAPLPLGSNSPLSSALIAIAASTTLMCWAVFMGRGLTSLHVATKSLRWPIVIYLGVCVWTLVQWSPFAPIILTDPIWKSTSELMNVPVQNRLSVNPEATISGLVHLLLYGSVFWLAFQVTRSSDHAWKLVRAISYIGCAYALYGIAIYLTGDEWVVIYPKTAYVGSLTSTFVNRNSYATFAGLGLLCASALVLDRLKTYFALKHKLRTKLVVIVEELVAKSALKTLAVLSIAISLFLTSSRAGILSSAAGIITLLLIFLVQQKLKLRHKIYLVAPMITLAILLFAVSGNAFSKRMDSDGIDTSFAFRNYMYAQTWEAINSSPLKGTGFGTFADVIPAFKEGRYGAPFERWDKAHNTYLENALELGLPAAALLNLAIALIALITVGGMSRRRRDRLIPTLGVCATILVALHSLVDFSLQIPAVAIFYACIMGVAASQSWSANLPSPTEPEVG